MRIRMLVLSLALASLASCGSTSDSGPEAQSAAISTSAVAQGNAGGNKIFDVMTRNLYLGISVEGVLQAPPEDLFVALATVLPTLQATDFPARAQAIADEIAASRPIVVGLQEATLWRSEFPSDWVPGSDPDATEVLYDFLEILQGALAERGLFYDVASVVENADLEVAVPISLDPLTLLDLRVTDRDAILVRQDVQWANEASENFVAFVPIAIPAENPIVEFPYRRGWNRVDVKNRGETIRILNVHLEPFVPAVRALQAAELLGLVDATDLPVIVLGDFNAFPGSDVYADLTGVLADIWSELGLEDGETCCIDDPLLTSETPTFVERVDLVLYRGPFVPLAAEVVGDDPGDRVASGPRLLWPSDHAGVVGKFRYVEPRFFSLR
jgi:hypothetical protein